MKLSVLEWKTSVAAECVGFQNSKQLHQQKEGVLVFMDGRFFAADGEFIDQFCNLYGTSFVQLCQQRRSGQFGGAAVIVGACGKVKVNA